MCNFIKLKSFYNKILYINKDNVVMIQQYYKDKRYTLIDTKDNDEYIIVIGCVDEIAKKLGYVSEKQYE